MSRKSKTVKVEGIEDVTVIYELTVRQIISIMEDDLLGTGASDIRSLVPLFKNEIIPKCTNIAPELLLDMTPSEIEKLWLEFKEFNKTFFVLARSLGLNKVIGILQEAAKEMFFEFVADLSGKDIPESTITDTVTSSEPTTKALDSNLNDSDKPQ